MGRSRVTSFGAFLVVTGIRLRANHNLWRITMNYSRVVGCIVLIGLLSCGRGECNAQEKGFATKGVTEFSGSVAFSSFTPVSNGTTGDATTLFSFGPKIGYFPFDEFELGFDPGVSLLPGISVETPAQGNSTVMLQLFAFVGYNFNLEGSKVHPFLEVPFGYTSMDTGNSTDTGFSWGVKGGVKIEIVGHVLLGIYGEYLVITLNPRNSIDRNGFNFLSFGIGVGAFL
jgi:hypothetical protein